MSDSITVQLDRLMTLREVAPLIRLSIGHSQYLLKRGQFPIKVIATRPYRFAPRDVQAFVERGERTNQPADTRRFFKGARRLREVS